ncbi:MAG: sirohydrochlorin chelatase [Gordonia sp. (in: high G+C Gram-positive bacteria)]
MLLLVGHGSRDPRFVATSRRVADAVGARVPGVEVQLAYLDLNEPLVSDVLGESSGDVTVVPLLFGDGYHSKIDLPAIIDDAQRANPGLRVTQTPIVGRHSPIPALVDQLFRSLSLSKGSLSLSKGLGVLLYAVGSSDTGSDASVRARGDELAGYLGVPVETVFATRLGPDGSAVRDAVARLRAAGAQQIAASPLFLSAGLLTERVERQLDLHAPGSLVAGPIGAHPALVGAVVSLYRSTTAPLLSVG